MTTKYTQKASLFIIISLLLTGCSSAPAGVGQITPTTTSERPLPSGSTTIAFSSVANFSIGSLDGKVPMPTTCVISQNIVDLDKLIARGGPQSLGDQGIDFSELTLISVFSSTGTSMAVQKVYEYQGVVVVEYATVTDQSRLLLPVIYSPNEHITIPKTAQPVKCVS